MMIIIASNKDKKTNNSYKNLKITIRIIIIIIIIIINTMPLSELTLFYILTYIFVINTTSRHTPYFLLITIFIWLMFENDSKRNKNNNIINNNSNNNHKNINNDYDATNNKNCNSNPNNWVSLTSINSPEARVKVFIEIIQSQILNFCIKR